MGLEDLLGQSGPEANDNWEPVTGFIFKSDGGYAFLCPPEDVDESGVLNRDAAVWLVHRSEITTDKDSVYVRQALEGDSIKWHECAPVLNAARKFTCWKCREIFDAEWSDEEALAESKFLWGDLPKEEMSPLCDDCFKEFIAWCRANGHIKDNG